MIIALTGLKGSGKTTTARALKSKLGPDWEIRSFADPIRDIAREVFGISEKKCMDRDLKQEENEFWGMSPRQILGMVGMMFRENFNKDIWVWVMQKRIEESDAENIIIDDLRFLNEAAWVRSHESEIFGVVRKDREHPKDCEPQSKTELQMSEHWSILVDHEVENELEGPQKVVERILEKFEDI